MSGKRSVLEEARRFWKQVDEVLQELIISRNINLRVFSLHIDRHVEQGGKTWTWWVPRRNIGNVLRELQVPTSLTMLEVDTRGKDEDFMDHKNNKDHICNVIRVLFSRLRHLRLRTATLCPSLIDPKYTSHASSSTMSELTAAPNLIALTLNLNTGLCRQSMKHCHGTLSKDRKKPNLRPTDALLNELTMTLGRARRAGKFPSAKKLQIIGEGTEQVDAETGFIILQDCLNRRTHLLPYVMLGDPSYELWMVRTVSGEQFFGCLDDIEEKIEGPVWEETIKGERFLSGEFRNSERSAEIGMQWSRLQLRDRSQFLTWLGKKSRPLILEDWNKFKDRPAISTLNSEVIPEEWLIMRSSD
ncbi:MAG: hypothetical protein LQ342_004480 [Letrouitia transgressa]|nr:MAG: hypothetical protein LQ342_004480 [Letrouitia transgressa]